MSYGVLAEAKCSGPKKGELKRRMKDIKEKLDSFVDLAHYVDIDYDTRNRLIGQLYGQYRAIKKELKGRKK